MKNKWTKLLFLGCVLGSCMGSQQETKAAF